MLLQVPTTVEFVDIAGLVRGASKGEGLGNKFLANIRETDAICQVCQWAQGLMAAKLLHVIMEAVCITWLWPPRCSVLLTVWHSWRVTGEMGCHTCWH